MIPRVFEWLLSDKNVFKAFHCRFEIMLTQENIPKPCVTVDFEIEDYLWRLTFWDSGEGVVETLHMESDPPVIFEDFDAELELSKAEPFQDFFERLGLKPEN